MRPRLDDPRLEQLVDSSGLAFSGSDDKEVNEDFVDDDLVDEHDMPCGRPALVYKNFVGDEIICDRIVN